jgi:hypothetical protein
MKISECMTREVETVKPDEPIRQAAQFMLRADAGSMPVCDGERLVGMLTDRDIAVRAVAEGRGPDTPVRDAMTPHVDYCYEDDEVEEVALKGATPRSAASRWSAATTSGWSASSRSATSPAATMTRRPRSRSKASPIRAASIVSPERPDAAA